MKYYGARCEEEFQGADAEVQTEEVRSPRKEKQLLTHAVQTELVKSPRNLRGSAQAEEDSGEIGSALQKGTYTVRVPALKRVKYVLGRHLLGSQHKKATGGDMLDVPSDAQMMFVYEAVKKSPMVPLSLLLLRGYFIA